MPRSAWRPRRERRSPCPSTIAADTGPSRTRAGGTRGSMPQRTIGRLRASHRGGRSDGETMVEGLPRSTRREFSRRLTFVPAGGEFFGWQQPRILTRVSYFYIDPKGPLMDPELRSGEAGLRPRLFFEDAALWATAAKLTQEIERGAKADRYYAEALSAVLVAELVRLDRQEPGSA